MKFRAFALWVAAIVLPLSAAARRVVVFKFDGVNAGVLDKWIDERNPRTGRSRLPWIDEIFARGGTRLDNFYVRGISLSAPSWSELDTGRHAIIRGNVEYDRWTLYAYDYLNFFPFYVNYSEKKQVDMPATEVLDEAKIPLLLDAFKPEERWQSYQLFQRGNDWSILRDSIPNHFRGRSPRQWFDEYETGLDLGASVAQEMERRLTRALADDRIVYLDLFSGDYDHTAHLTNDPESQLRALQSLDTLVGRIWTAARASNLGADTVFVMVSDHGMNTRPDVLSQGYSLVKWFNSAEGGGHHVITDRYPLATFKIRGLDPFVHKVTTPSQESAYLKDQAERYPTVLLDLDGNERAAVQLRSNAWNVVQILLERLNHGELSAGGKEACRAEVRRWAESRAAIWAKEKIALNPSLAAINQSAEEAELRVARQRAGHDLEARRAEVLGKRLREREHQYREFIKAMDEFLEMPANARESLTPKQSLGDANSLYDLQNYVVGMAPGGLAMDGQGRLDLVRSFRRIDYFEALHDIRVRNPMQKGMSSHPVDFIAVRLDTRAAENALQESGLLTAVWLYGSAERQAIVLYREKGGRLEIRYIPAAHLSASKEGAITLDRPEWASGFPLAIFEDPALSMQRDSLTTWHDESEWMAALANTRYSNGLIGLSELFRPLEVADGPRRREMMQPDFEIFAADHWNFNVRNFNPGGNHGAFFRESTHSVLMFAGGGIPAGLRIQHPYDSLSLAPTILQLMNRELPGPMLPGAPVRELFAP